MRLTRPATRWVLPLALASALALTACSNDSNNNSGGSGLGNGGSGQTYKIAFQGPLSGDNAQLGINEVNGVELAIEQANKNNDLGFKVELVKADDGG